MRAAACPSNSPADRRLGPHLLPGRPGLDLPGVWTKTLHYLEQSVAHWVMRGGALAVMIPAVDRSSLVTRSDLNLHDYAAALDGLVLQGGNDVAPESYGETPLHPDWPATGARPLRDGTGRRLHRRRQAGVRHLPRPAAAQRDASAARCAGHPHAAAGRWRTATAATTSALPRRSSSCPAPGWRSSTRDVRRATVNSIHHQAIKDLAPGFDVEARCPEDGMIEAIRWRGPATWPRCSGTPSSTTAASRRTFDDTPLLARLPARRPRADARQRLNPCPR
jgi:putative glutamine amidotransferase